MTDLIDTVQLDEVPAGIVELFDFTLPSGTVIHLFNGLDNGTDNVCFPSKTVTSEGYYPINTYIAIPLELNGVEFNAAGASSRPSLSIANIPTLSRSINLSTETTLDDIRRSENILAEEGIFSNEDLLGTQVVYRTTLTTHLKSQPYAENPTPAVEFPSQKFILDRVASENNIFVEFELASPFDLEGVTLPNRKVIGKYCSWQYQGQKLGNRGGCTWDLNSRGRFYDKNDNLICTDDTLPPSYSTIADDDEIDAGSKFHTDDNGYIRIWETVRDTPGSAKDPRVNAPYWKRIDVCGKLLSSCKARYQGNKVNNDLDTTKELPFGGFPGSLKFK